MPAVLDLTPAELSQLRDELRGRREAADREARGAARRRELERRELEERAEAQAAAAARRRAREGRDADAREAAARADGEARAEALGHERDFVERHGTESYAIPGSPDGVRVFATGARKNARGDHWEPPWSPAERAAAVFTYAKAKHAFLLAEYERGRTDVTGAARLIAKGAKIPPPTDDQFRWLEAAAERVREAEAEMVAAWEKTPAAAARRDRDRREAARRTEASGLQHRAAALPAFGD